MGVNFDNGTPPLSSSRIWSLGDLGPESGPGSLHPGNCLNLARGSASPDWTSQRKVPTAISGPLRARHTLGTWAQQTRSEPASD